MVFVCHEALRELHRMIDPKAVIAFALSVRGALTKRSVAKQSQDFAIATLREGSAYISLRSVCNDNWAFLFVEVSKEISTPGLVASLYRGTIFAWANSLRANANSSNA
jgi:hypothetical protein